MKTIAVVTGASSGLGEVFVYQLDSDSRLDEIWLCARRRKRLEAIAEHLKTPVRILDGDVTNQIWLDTLAEHLKMESVQIHTLVNSAGIGKIGNFDEIGTLQNAHIIEVNILALTKICSTCLPYMAKQGRILNIASVAAFLPQAGFAVYAASKAYVVSFSRALNQELSERDITVTAVCPNPMETEFFFYAGRKNRKTSIKNLGFEDVNKVAAIALKKSSKKKDISLSSFLARLIRLLSRLLPHRFILKAEQWLGL